MVLVRRRTVFVEELVRALKAAQVPVAGVDRMVLTDQIAVMDLFALARFLLLPEDDLTLACVLKSPLVGLSEEQLFELAYARGEASLWHELARRADEDAAFAAAHAYLADLLRRVDFTPPYELFAEVLGSKGRPEERSGLKRMLARLGPEAQEPLEEFLALALAYERAHVPSLEGFLHWVRSGEAEIKRDPEASAPRRGAHHDRARREGTRGADRHSCPTPCKPRRRARAFSGSTAAKQASFGRPDASTRRRLPRACARRPSASATRNTAASSMSP